MRNSPSYICISQTQIINLTAGSSSATLTFAPTQIEQFNLQNFIGDLSESSPFIEPITFSFLTRTGNFDITILAGMTPSEAIALIALTGVILEDGYLTFPPEMRPLVVLGLVSDLPILAPLLGLLPPEAAISGLTFSYPINGIRFPLPAGLNLSTPLLSISLGTQNLIVNTIPNNNDINNRYVISTLNPISTITVGVYSIYGVPLQTAKPCTVVLKLN